MKKKLLLLTVALVTLVSLFSCNGNSGAGGTKELGTIYGDGIRAHIVYDTDKTQNPDVSAKLGSQMSSIIGGAAGYYPYVYKSSTAPDENEILVGDTNRALSKTAKEALDKKIRNKINSLEFDLEGWDEMVGYAVCSDGKSVAIVWTDWHVEEEAVKYFLENFILGDSLKLEAGYVKTEIFSLQEYLAARNERVEEDQWETFRDSIPKEYSKYADGIVTSLQSLYKLYDIDMVRWLANLYDPEVVIVDSQGNPVPEYNQEGNVIYGGGWYHSNSGRDNEGFLPDIENTYVALEFVASTGMAELFNDKWETPGALPDWVKEQVGLWFKHLQDPDTFFYHPQWSKEFINANGLQSRITRDRGSARTTLRKLGVAELYPGVAASSSDLTGRLSDSSSTVVAVSKVVATAGMLWQYQSNENFEKYLEGLDAELATYTDPSSKAARFYSYGNNFQSTTNMMTPEMKKMTVAFFDKHQNPETGTWDEVPSYSATNGIHKIGAVYNAIGAKMNYIDQMVESCIEVVSWTVEEKPIGAGVDLYNAWSCFPYIYTNVRKHDPNGATKIQEIKDRIFSAAPEMIEMARDQIAGFRRPDGSYGYSRTGSCPRAQGAPVALAGVNEGDVNGNAIASLDVILYILKALELDSAMPDMFHEYERMEFVHILNNLGPVIKCEEELGEDILHTFEEYVEGDLPDGYSTELDAGRNPIEGTYAKLVKNDGNTVLEVQARHRGTDANGRNLSLKAPITPLRSASNMAHIEFDLHVYSEETVPSTSLIQFNIAGNGAPVIYLDFNLDAKGNIYIRNMNNNAKVADIGKVDETISFKIEYYWVDQVYKIYANGIYVGGGSDTYNKRTHQEVQNVTLGAPSTVTAHYFIDNVRMIRTYREYFDETAAISPNHKFEGEADGTQITGFIGNGVNVVPGEGSVNYAGDGKTLAVHGSGTGAAPTVTIPTFTSEGITPNRTKFNLDFKAVSLKDGAMKIAVIGKDGRVLTGLGFAESSGGTKLVGNHYSADLLTSFACFYMADNLEGAEDISFELIYTYETGIMEIKVGDEKYVSIAGVTDGIGSVKIVFEGDALAELDEAYFENIYKELPPNVDVKVDPSAETFEGDYTSKEETWDCTHASHKGEKTQSVTNLYFPTGVNAVFNAEAIYANTHGAVARVLADATSGDKYLSIVAPKRVSDRDRAHNYVINAQNCVLDPNVYVIETDIKLDSVLPDGTASHGTYLQISLTNDVANKYVMFMMSNNPAKVTLSGIELGDWDTWFRLKIEYYPAQGVIQLYANDTFKGELKEGYGATSSSDKSFASLGDRITKVSFSGANSSTAGFSVNFDNSCLYSMKGKYVAGKVPEVEKPDEPEVEKPTAPVYETFDSVKETEGVSNNIVGSTGAAVSYTAGVNESGSRAYLRTDEATGNKFVTIYSPGRVNTKDRSHGVTAPITVLSGDANMIALEADLFLNSRSVSSQYVQILFAHGQNNAIYGQLNMSIKDGAAYFGGIKVGYLDEWFTLKFEYYLDAGKLKVFNGDSFLGEITSFSQSSSGRVVADIKEISLVSINTYNAAGAFLVNVDNVAVYKVAKEYAEQTPVNLPEAKPTPDTFDPSSEGGNEGGNEGGGTDDPVDPPVNPPVNPPVTPPSEDPDPVIPDSDENWPEITPPEKEGVDDGDVGEWT